MNNQAEQIANQKELSFDEFRLVVLNDYRIVCESREASLLGRKEVLTGKAKFGIFGDGKEVAQVAMAKVFQPGDFRSGYYRDQTFMIASGLLTIQELFAQLYAHADEVAEPMSAGRSMNGHFASRTVNKDGSWKQLTELKNSSADISPTAGQMPRLLGLAYASKVFRTNPELSKFSQFSINGNEVAFGTIGDASTSEGLFFETINAAGVLQVPLAMSVWDDGYGISVSTAYQTTKGNISKALAGFEANEDDLGYLMLSAKGWDYAELCEMYQMGIASCRKNHIPVLFHITELTQPQGHSTSGSHERYKTKERLSWELEYDCIKKMREWILQASFAAETELEEIEKAAKITVREAKRAAWEAFQNPIKQKQAELNAILIKLSESTGETSIAAINEVLSKNKEPQIRDVMEASRHALRVARIHTHNEQRVELKNWIEKQGIEHKEIFNSWLMSETSESALTISGVSPQYADEIVLVDGREIIRDNYDKILETNPLFLTFGEDSGGIGGVNQTLEGLQKKYGEIRVSDTGIREATIVGQGIGLAMRGLRPIAEIQYLDYLLYALQILSDDLSTLRYRTKGNQKAPLIVSTRGHRLEGVWHSGSPLGVIIHALRGMYICVPRNMTQAAGFYNTLLAGDDPALVIEPLNGYRAKERKPVNMGEFRIELGTPEILAEGTDLSLVTYGSCCKIALEACLQLSEMGVSVELIDVQTLLPFDLKHTIVESLKKTGKLLIVDEDVPGGASAFILQQILEVQGGFRYLDAEPATLTAKEHRTAYGSDGDYFSKPSLDDIVETAYSLLERYNPSHYPAIY